MKKVTLQVNRRKQTFSEQELSSILEEHILENTIKKAMTAKVAQKPTEDEWFEVKPYTIDQQLFKKKRKDEQQEATRQLILKAFAEMKNDLEKYGINFRTMIPKQEWAYKTVAQLKEMARRLGGHNADWVEQALEWAQRIANGESWEAICNDADTANWYRLVVWKRGYVRLVGGSVYAGNKYPASNVYFKDFDVNSSFYYVVPLVVLYEW